MSSLEHFLFFTVEISLIRKSDRSSGNDMYFMTFLFVTQHCTQVHIEHQHMSYFDIVKKLNNSRNNKMISRLILSQSLETFKSNIHIAFLKKPLTKHSYQMSLTSATKLNKYVCILFIDSFLF